MKKLFLAFTLALALSSCDKFLTHPNDSGSSTGTNTSNVPSAVKSAFAAKYPIASRMEWQLENGGQPAFWSFTFFIIMTFVLV